MAKIIEEIRTLIGRVVRVGNDELDKKTKKVLSTRNRFISKNGKEGMNIEICQQGSGLFWQVTVFGNENFAQLDGLSIDKNEDGKLVRVVTHPSLEVKQMVCVTAPYELRSWIDSTTGEKKSKNSLRVFNFREQVEFLELPEYKGRTAPATEEIPKHTSSRRRAS